MEQHNETYIKGFNDGYKLARYNPELFDKLKEGLSQDSEYNEGVIAGAEQWVKEKEKQRLAELGDLDQGQQRGQELERE